MPRSKSKKGEEISSDTEAGANAKKSKASKSKKKGAETNSRFSSPGSDQPFSPKNENGETLKEDEEPEEFVIEEIDEMDMETLKTSIESVKKQITKLEEELGDDILSEGKKK